MPKTSFRSDTPPTLEEAQSLVGGYVSLIPLEDGSQMLVDEDGLSKRLPLNLTACDHAKQRIVGDVLILTDNARWLPESGST